MGGAIGWRPHYGKVRIETAVKLGWQEGLGGKARTNLSLHGAKEGSPQPPEPVLPGSRGARAAVCALAASGALWTRF